MFQGATYSIGKKILFYFHAKIKAEYLQQKKNWSTPQIKDLHLII